jgi:hypothetical protein
MRMKPAVALITVLAACAKPPDGGVIDVDEAAGSAAPCASYDEVTIGCRPVTDADRERVGSWEAPPMYALGDVNGNGEIDRDDARRLQRALARSAELDPCARAADVDFDTQLTGDDLRFIESVRGAPELYLFNSASLSCTAFLPIGSRMLGEAGNQVPLVFFGDLRVPIDHIVVSPPGVLEAEDASEQIYSIHIPDGTASGTLIETRIYVGATPEVFEANLRARRSAKLYITRFTVVSDHAAQ